MISQITVIAIGMRVVVEAVPPLEIRYDVARGG